MGKERQVEGQEGINANHIQNLTSEILNQQKQVSHLLKITASMTKAVEHLARGGDKGSLLQVVTYSRLIDAVILMQRQLGQIRDGIKQLRTGSLAEILVKPRELGKILNQIKKDLPDGYGLVFEDAMKYYQPGYGDIHLIPSQESITALIYIPVSKDKAHFMLHQTKAIPTPKLRNGKRAMYDGPEVQIGINYQHGLYLEVERQELEQNCHNTMPKLCRLTVMQYHVPAKRCLYSLITQVEKVEGCPYRVVNRTEPVVMKLDTNQWIISVENVTQLEVSCTRDREDSQRLTLTDNHLVTIPEECTARLGKEIVLNEAIMQGTPGILNNETEENILKELGYVQAIEGADTQWWENNMAQDDKSVRNLSVSLDQEEKRLQRIEQAISEQKPKESTTWPIWEEGANRQPRWTVTQMLTIAATGLSVGSIGLLVWKIWRDQRDAGRYRRGFRVNNQVFAMPTLATPGRTPEPRDPDWTRA
jgi:hypothetical protein